MQPVVKLVSAAPSVPSATITGATIPGSVQKYIVVSLPPPATPKPFWPLPPPPWGRSSPPRLPSPTKLSLETAPRGTWGHPVTPKGDKAPQCVPSVTCVPPQRSPMWDSSMGTLEVAWQGLQRAPM